MQELAALMAGFETLLAGIGTLIKAIDTARQNKKPSVKNRKQKP